jgi:NADH-quinone oxidoreductase subunit L
MLNAPMFHWEPMGHWLDPVFEEAAEKGIREVANSKALEWPLAVAPFLAFLGGTAVAYWMYIAQKGEPARKLAEAQPKLYQLVLDKWRIDELYEATVYSAVDSLAETAVAFDKYVVDGIIAKLTAAVVKGFGLFLRAFQNGVVHVYAAFMVVGLVGVGSYLALPHAEVAIVEKSNGDYFVTAGPGLSYGYRWDADGDGKPDTTDFGTQTQVRVHLDPDKSQIVRLEVKNAFGLVGAREISLSRPKPKEEPKTIKLGQN